MSTPTLPIVAPKPVPKLVTTLLGSRPAARPVPIAPIIRARNGCSLSQEIKTITTANPASAETIRRVSLTPAAAAMGATRGSEAVSTGPP